MQGREQAPAPKVVEGEDEPWDSGALKEAQSITGEVQWLANRTRPDIAYTAGLMARMLHRRPKYVAELGNHLLRYLNGTVKCGLSYKPLTAWNKDRPWEDDNSLGVLKVFSDASFAPPHEQYRSVQGLLVEHGRNPILWSSSRQAFIVQSTAEAELLSYNESYQAGESTGALSEILGYETEKQLLGDNKAALVLCTGETGPWRTRHLRLRAAKLREAVQEGGGWKASHLRGDQLVADGLTKSLQGQAHEKFLDQLSMRSSVSVRALKEKQPLKAEETSVTASVCSMKLLIPGALAATSAALVMSGRPGLGAVVGLCAVLLGAGQKKDQEQSRLEQKASIGGGESQKEAQDGKPSHGGATRVTKADEVGYFETAQDGKPLDGGATRVTKARQVGYSERGVQDGKSADGATRIQKTQILGRDSSSQSSPALRAFRLRSDSHGASSSAPAGELRRDEGSRRSSALSRGAAAIGSRSMTSGGEDAVGELEAAVGASEAGGDSTAWSVVSSTGATYAQGDREPENFMIGPWNNVEFATPWSGRDRSFLGLWSEGWLIRVHAQARQRRFIAASSKTPCPLNQLDGERVTLRLMQDGSTFVTSDEMDRYVQEAELWKGFTFLRLSGGEFAQPVVRPRSLRDAIQSLG